jgi:YfiH family protein
MIKNDYKGIVFYTFNNLSKEKRINHLFSTRIGGVSEGKFASMNLSYSRNDDSGHVTENFRKISEIGFPVEKMALSDQVHETKIRNVFESDCGKGILTKSDIVGVDGLMTNVPGIVLVTFHADCTPIYFYDKAKNVIALAHAGWRGTFMEIGKITINEMKEKFGSCPNDILVGIGPSICKSCFEVGSEVADMFTRKFHYSAQFITSSHTDPNKSFIDLWGINKQMLIDSGILEQNIELPDLCTKCNTDIFYSHRAMGWDRGNMAAFLSLCVY